MRLTTWTEYSLIISIHLARRQHAGLGPVSGRELAEAEQLPPDYVEQILLRLRRAGLIRSVRGARGGYSLARAPGSISVRDVMSASEHQAFEINCESHQVHPERCQPSNSCSLRPVWVALQQKVDDFLAGISLADLMHQETRVVELVGMSRASGLAPVL